MANKGKKSLINFEVTQDLSDLTDEYVAEMAAKCNVTPEYVRSEYEEYRTARLAELAAPPAEPTIEELLASLPAGVRKDALMAAIKGAAKEESDRKIRVDAQDLFEDFFASMLEDVEDSDLEVLGKAGATVTVKLEVVKDAAGKHSADLTFGWGVAPSQVLQTSNGTSSGQPMVTWDEDRIKVAFACGSSGKAGDKLGIRGNSVAAAVKNYCGVPYAQARQSFNDTGIVLRKSK